MGRGEAIGSVASGSTRKRISARISRPLCGRPDAIHCTEGDPFRGADVFLHPTNEKENVEAPPEFPDKPRMACDDCVDGGAHPQRRTRTHEHGETVVVVEDANQVFEYAGVLFQTARVAHTFPCRELPSDDVGAMDHLYGALSGMHRDIHAGGKDRVEEAACVTDQNNASRSQATPKITVVGGDAERFHGLSVAYELAQFRRRRDDFLKERVWFRSPFAQGVGRGHEPDGGFLLVERNKPEPPVGEAHHDGVAGGFARRARNAGEMTVDGDSSLKPWRIEFSFQITGENVFPASSIKYPGHGYIAFRSRCSDADPTPTLDRSDAADRGAAKDGRAQLFRMLEKKGVKFRALDLIGVIQSRDHSFRENHFFLGGAFGEKEIGPVFFKKSRGLDLWPSSAGPENFVSVGQE